MRVFGLVLLIILCFIAVGFYTMGAKKEHEKNQAVDAKEAHKGEKEKPKAED